MIKFGSVVCRLGAPLILSGWALTAVAAPSTNYGLSKDGDTNAPASPGTPSDIGSPAWAQNQFLGLLNPESIRTEGFSNATLGATYQGTSGDGALKFAPVDGGSGATVSASMRPTAPMPPQSETNPIPPPTQNPGLVASTTSAGFAGRFNTTGGYSSGKWLNGQWWEATGLFKIDFDGAGVNAFGFFLTDAYDFDGTLSLILDAGTINAKTLTLPNSGLPAGESSLIFFGFTDRERAYKTITFDIVQKGTVPVNFDVFGLDDMLIGELANTGGNVPEPATLALVAASLAALAATRRRRPR